MARRRYRNGGDDLSGAPSTFYETGPVRTTIIRGPLLDSATDKGGGWGEFDAALLDGGRPSVPAFPLEVLPPLWRDWARDTGRAAGAPVDYVALSLITAVAGLAGAGVRVQAGPGWQEPLVLWQALLGGASSGKSPAIASLRAILATLDAASGTDKSPYPLGDAIVADPRGTLLCCDEPLDWLPQLAGATSAARTQLLRGWSPSSGAAIGILASLPPDHVSRLVRIGPELAARFLFTWPQAAPYCPLGERRLPADAEALAALRRLRNMVGTAEAPAILALARDALPPLDSFLATLHGELLEAEGLDQAWQGKGRGTVVRLIGCLALLERSIGAAAAADVVSRQTVERAVALWRNYLRPHARAILQLATPDDVEHNARRVVRWLKAGHVDAFSREEIREHALGRCLNAAGTEQVLYRLKAAGFVRQIPFSMPSQGGRPPSRWEVNPRLRAAGNPGNPGNLPEGG